MPKYKAEITYLQFGTEQNVFFYIIHLFMEYSVERGPICVCDVKKYPDMLQDLIGNKRAIYQGK